MIGIEINPEMAEIAKKHGVKVIIADVETLKDLPFTDFDVIVFGDILEHHREPLKVLKNLIRYLKDDGY